MYGKYNILIGAIGYWLLAIGLLSCRTDEVTYPSEYEVLPMESRELSSFASNEPIGMYPVRYPTEYDDDRQSKQKQVDHRTNGRHFDLFVCSLTSSIWNPV